MPNPYFNKNDEPQNATKADATDIDTQLDRLEAAFDMLPDPTALAAGAINYADEDTGVANAYIIDLPLVTALYAGLWVLFPAGNTNTGASVLNVSDLGNVAILDQAASALTGGEIVGGSIVSAIYTGTNWQLLTSGVTSAVTTAVAEAVQAAADAEAAAAAAEAALAAMTQTPTFSTVVTTENVTARQYGVDHLTVAIVGGNATFPLDEAGTFDISVTESCTVTLTATDLTKSYEFTIYATTTGAFNFTDITMTGIGIVRKVGTTINLQASGDTVVSCLYIPAISKLVVTEIDVEAI